MFRAFRRQAAVGLSRVPLSLHWTLRLPTAAPPFQSLTQLGACAKCQFPPQRKISRRACTQKGMSKKFNLRWLSLSKPPYLVQWSFRQVVPEPVEGFNDPYSHYLLDSPHVQNASFPRKEKSPACLQAESLTIICILYKILLQKMTL